MSDVATLVISAADIDSVTLLTGFSHIGLTVVIPERFQIVNGQDALQAGLHLLPLLGSCAVGSFLAGAISSKRNHTSSTLVIASALQLIGVSLLAMLDDPESDMKASYGFQAIFGLGVGLSYGAATILTGIHASAHSDLAVAQGAVAQARVLGGCIGVAICTVVFNSHINDKLGDMSQEALETLHKSPLLFNEFPPEARDFVRHIYASAFAQDSTIMAYVCAGMFLISLMTFETRPAPLERLTESKKDDDMRENLELEPRDSQSTHVV